MSGEGRKCNVPEHEHYTSFTNLLHNHVHTFEWCGNVTYHQGRSCCIQPEIVNFTGPTGGNVVIGNSALTSFGAPLGTGGAGQVMIGLSGGGSAWTDLPGRDFPQRLVPVYPHIQKLGLLTVTTTDDGAVSMDVDNSPFLPDGVTPRRYVLGPTLTMIVNTAIDARLNELKAKVEAMWDAPGMPGWMEVKDEVEKIVTSDE